MHTPVPEMLSNPHGGAVRAAVAALLEARRTLGAPAPACAMCEAAAQSFTSAGWLSAQRFSLALARALQRQAPGISSALEAAFDAFLTVLDHCNLWELACSPQLWAHYAALLDNEGADRHAVSGAGSIAYSPWQIADYALAGRPLPRAILHPHAPERIALVRSEIEVVLLGALRAPQLPREALVTITVTLNELAGPHPYDFWRLAAATVRVQGTGTQLVKQWLARLNLLLAEHGRGRSEVDAALVRLTLALLWRDYALHGAAHEDAADIELLRDYGLEVPVRVAHAPAGAAALWDQAQQEPPRELGPVTVDARAFEDFLQTADAALAELPASPSATQALPPGVALQAAAAAARVGAAAWTLGLGQIALLGDALGLAWRHGVLINSLGAVQAPAGTTPAAEALRAALYKIAAGLPPPDLSTAREALAAGFSALA
jgi:hypothetical protein